jgi:hypothetical protein
VPAEPSREQAPGALQLVERDGAFVLHNDWFEATFPGKPWLVATDDKTPTGQRIPATVAQFDDGSTSCTVIVHSIPKDVTYDAEHALTDARDETLKGAYATLVSDTTATVNGIPAHRVVARGGTDAVPLYVEAVLFYDDKHRALVSAGAMTRGGSGLDPRATGVLMRRGRARLWDPLLHEGPRWKSSPCS